MLDVLGFLGGFSLLMLVFNSVFVLGDLKAAVAISPPHVFSTVHVFRPGAAIRITVPLLLLLGARRLPLSF